MKRIGSLLLSGPAKSVVLLIRRMGFHRFLPCRQNNLEFGTFLTAGSVWILRDGQECRIFPLQPKGKSGMLPMCSKGSEKRMNKSRLELIRGTLDVLILKSLIWGPLHGY